MKELMPFYAWDLDDETIYTDYVPEEKLPPGHKTKGLTLLVNSKLTKEKTIFLLNQLIGYLQYSNDFRLESDKQKDGQTKILSIYEKHRRDNQKQMDSFEGRNKNKS